LDGVGVSEVAEFSVTLEHKQLTIATHGVDLSSTDKTTLEQDNNHNNNKTLHSATEIIIEALVAAQVD